LPLRASSSGPRPSGLAPLGLSSTQLAQRKYRVPSRGRYGRHPNWRAWAEQLAGPPPPQAATGDASWEGVAVGRGGGEVVAVVSPRLTQRSLVAAFQKAHADPGEGRYSRSSQQQAHCHQLATQYCGWWIRRSRGDRFVVLGRNLALSDAHRVNAPRASASVAPLCQLAGGPRKHQSISRPYLATGRACVHFSSLVQWQLQPSSYPLNSPQSPNSVGASWRSYRVNRVQPPSRGLFGAI
jgi:hypothetical protein